MSDAVVFMLTLVKNPDDSFFRKEMSAYYLEHASVDHIHSHFDQFEAEARRLLDLGLAIPAYTVLPLSCIIFIVY